MKRTENRNNPWQAPFLSLPSEDIVILTMGTQFCSGLIKLIFWWSPSPLNTVNSCWMFHAWVIMKAWRTYRVCLHFLFCWNTNFYPPVGVGWWCCQPASPSVISQYRHRLYIYWLLTAGYHGRQPALPSLSLSLLPAGWPCSVPRLSSPLLPDQWLLHLLDTETSWETNWHYYMDYCYCATSSLYCWNRQLYYILYIFYFSSDILNVVI